jgi:hypothetical protein
MVDIRKPLNVFAQSAVAGQIAEITAAGPASQTVMMDPASVDTVLPAYPVMLVTGTSAVPLVDLAAPGTDPIYGFALFNPKVSSWVKEDVLQVTTRDAVMFMTSSGALARGAQVGMDPVTYKLIAATTTNYIGQLLDDATTDQLVRVELCVPLTVAP